MCHFERAIEENFIQRYFGLVGKIKQVHLGEYKNKANNKRKRRTVYFALVVYTNAEDCRLALNDSKYLQSKVNKVTKKGVKFTSNPFQKDADEEEEFDEDTKNEMDAHKSKMEEGGFTVVK